MLCRMTAGRKGQHILSSIIWVTNLMGARGRLPFVGRPAVINCGAAATRGGHLLLGAGATASIVSGLMISCLCTAVGAATRRFAPGPALACFAVLPRQPSIMTVPAGTSLARRQSALTSSSMAPRCGSRMMSMQSSKGGVQQWEGLKLSVPGYEGALTRADPMTGEPTGKDVVWSVEVNVVARPSRRQARYTLLIAN